MVVVLIELVVVVAATSAALAAARGWERDLDRRWLARLNVAIVALSGLALALAALKLRVVPPIAAVLLFVVNYIVVNALVVTGWHVGHRRWHRADLASPPRPVQIDQHGEVASLIAEAGTFGFKVVDGTAHEAHGGHGTSVILVDDEWRVLEVIADGPVPPSFGMASTAAAVGDDLVTPGVSLTGVVAAHLEREREMRERGEVFVRAAPEEVLERSRQVDREFFAGPPRRDWLVSIRQISSESPLLWLGIKQPPRRVIG